MFCPKAIRQKPDVLGETWASALPPSVFPVASVFHVSADHPRDSQRAQHTTYVSVLAATTHSATVLSKYIVRHERAAIAYGEYEDTLVRTADGWRIAYRKTFRRALGIDDGQSDHFEVDANGRRIRAPAQA